MVSREQHMKPPITPPTDPPKLPVDSSKQNPKPFNLKEFGNQLAEEAVKKLNKLP